MTGVTVTRITRNCDPCHTAKHKLGRRLRALAPGMTVAAVHLRQVSNIDRMLERQPGYSRGRRTLLLRHHRVTGIAFLRDDLAFRAHVLSVMAAEAAAGVVVAKVGGMGLPFHLHFGEHGSTIDRLYFVN